MSDIEIIPPSVEAEIVIGTVAQVGPPGVDGAGATNNILYGTINPASDVGSNGNFYINSAAWTLFGPKAAGTWPAGVSMIGADGADGAAGAAGADGADGATIRSGSGVPSNGLGNNGDVYLDLTAFKIHQKSAGVWDAGTAFGGPQGESGAAGAAGADGADGTDGKTILNGSGAPGAIGTDGDYYLDNAATRLYGPRTAGAWGSGIVLIGPTGSAGADGADGAAGSAGADGADGRTLLSGSGAPSGGTGADGDFYINTAVPAIYGPKTAGAWGSATSLIGATGAEGAAGSAGADGADGKTILYGTVAPTTEGVDGDFYIRTTTNFIYGPKASGTWPAGTSLVGPTGAAGGSEITAATPSTPSAGTISLARVKRAARESLGFINSLGRVTELARSFARGRMAFMNCGLGALHGFGVNVSTTTGTQTFPTPAGTNILTRARRAQYASAATASAGAGWNDNTSHMFPISGFHSTFIFGFSDPATVAASRSFIGYKSATTAIGGAEPSSFTDMFGFGHDSSDTYLQFMHNDNTGTATKVALTGIDPQEVGTIYQATMHMEPGGSELFYQIINLATGTTVEGSVSTDLPTGTTSVKPFMHRGNGATTLAVQIDVLAYVLEGEYA